MPLPTPFHSRTAPLCLSGEWRNWSGYLSAVSYGHAHDHEYYAIRNGVALIDVTPLFKYDINGLDACRLVDRIITRDISTCRNGQVIYTTWCDEAGKMIDDGTVQRFSDTHLRITSTDPNLRWFRDCAYGMTVEVRDVTENLAALALQGPNSRDVLKQVWEGGDADQVKFFYMAGGTIGGFEVMVSRTGYTGDLGYELWTDVKNAAKLWDLLMEAGRGYGIAPAGLAALDIVRIEAGLLLKEVDYTSTQTALIEARKSSPYEAGLGWAVKLKKGDFVGKRALLAEKASPSNWVFAGFEIDWIHLEKLFAEADLPPHVAGRASRVPVPIYHKGKQVGYASSSTFSPILKKYIAIGTLEAQYGAPGTELQIEVTVEFERKLCRATVVETPFFNPPRKRA